MSGWPGQKVSGGAQSAPVTVQPIFTAPADPNKAAENARQDQQANNDQVRTGIAVRGEQRDVDKTAFDQTTTLRKEFEALPAVQSYKAILPTAMDALSAQEGGTSDAMLIYAYAKMLDPAGAVREGDADMMQSGQSTVAAWETKIRREFGADEAGTLSPEKRAELRLRINNRLAELNTAYGDAMMHYRDLASGYGIEPSRVVGGHPGDPYRARYEQIRARMNGQGPQSRAGLPGGTTIWTPAQSREYWGGDYVDPDGRPLGPQGGQAFDARTGEFAGEFIVGGNSPDWRNDPQLRQELRDKYRGMGGDPNSTSAVLDSGIDKLTFGLPSNAIGAVEGVKAMLNGQDFGDAYRAGRDATRLYYQDTGNEQPGPTTAANIAGTLGSGFLLPIRNPVQAGVAAGGLSGFNEGETLGERAKNAIVGGVVGGAIGKGVDKLAEGMAARRAAQPAEALSDGGKVIQSADNLNAQFGTDIRPLPADVAGPGIQNASGKMTQFPLSAGQIVGASRKLSAEAQAARDAIAAMAGKTTTGEQGAEAAINGAKKWMQTTKTKVDALYAKAKRGGASEPVDLKNTRDLVDGMLEEMRNVPGGAKGLKEMEDFRASLDSPYPVQGVKDLRTELNEKWATDALRKNRMQARAAAIADSAEADVVASLNAAGKGSAAKAYAEAAKAHAERVTIIDDVITPFIGKDGDNSPEMVLSAIESASKRNGGRLGEFLRAMPADDAATVRATLISRLGRATDGQQNAEGNAFSLSRFLTQWSGMSNAAKSELFGGELRAALDDLAKVASGTKSAQRFENFSGTGGVFGIGSTGAALMAGPKGWILIAADALGGKALSSPKVARWLAKMPSDPRMVEKHAAALSKIAANDNTISAEVSAAQSALQSALSGGGAKHVAAQPGQEGPSKTAPTTTRGATQ